MAKLGRMLAERPQRLGGADRGDRPDQGLLLIDVEGGPLWDQEADLALVEALESDLREEIKVERVDLPVNDPEFGRLVARRFIELANRGPDHRVGPAGGEER